GTHRLSRRVNRHELPAVQGQVRRAARHVGNAQIAESRTVLFAVIRGTRAEGQCRAGRSGDVIERDTAIGADLPLDRWCRAAAGRRAEAHVARTHRLTRRVQRHHRPAVYYDRLRTILTITARIGCSVSPGNYLW